VLKLDIAVVNDLPPLTLIDSTVPVGISAEIGLSKRFDGKLKAVNT